MHLLGIDIGGTFTDFALLDTGTGELRTHKLLTTPDDYVETFESPSVFHETHRAGDTEVTYVQYTTDLDPSDTEVETVFVFFINEGGEVRVEVDRHVTGLFPISTWERLLDAAGFTAEKVDYPFSEQGRPTFLWVARLRAAGETA